MCTHVHIISLFNPIYIYLGVNNAQLEAPNASYNSIGSRSYLYPNTHIYTSSLGRLASPPMRPLLGIGVLTKSPIHFSSSYSPACMTFLPTESPATPLPSLLR